MKKLLIIALLIVGCDEDNSEICVYKCTHFYRCWNNTSEVICIHKSDAMDTGPIADYKDCSEYFEMAPPDSNGEKDCLIDPLTLYLSICLFFLGSDNGHFPL